LKSFRTRMPVPFEIAAGDARINAIVVTIDSNSKEAERIERVKINAEYKEEKTYDSDDGKPEHFNNNF